MTKKLVAILAVVLVFGAAVGATLAWLTDKTDSVKNTFTVGDINIDLTETTKDYKMVPGNEIAKDPTITVAANSEACWLFVKVEKSANFDSFMTYEIDDEWTPLENVEGVYYREVGATKGSPYICEVLKNSKVTVKDTVTKEMLNALTEDTYPTLTFTAYAVQKDNIADAATAWSKVTA